MPSAVPRAATRRLAPALALLSVAELIVMVVSAMVLGTGLTVAVESFAVTDSIIGIGAAVCGGIVARYRPRHPLGWLLLGVGVLATNTAVVAPWLVAAVRSGWSDSVVRTLATAYSPWPLAVMVFLPLAVLVFPDGRLPFGHPRLLVSVVGANGLLQMVLSASSSPLRSVSDPVLHDAGRAVSWFGVQGWGDPSVLYAISDVVVIGTYLAGFLALVLRYRRGDERTRRQLLWLLFGAAAAVGAIVGEQVFPVDGNVVVILADTLVTLIPIAMTVAVLRYQLLDIRLVWSRTLVYAALTALLAGTYLGIVLLLQVALEPVTEQSGPAVAVSTLVCAALFRPARAAIQTVVDRRFYRSHYDARHTVDTFGERLRDPVDLDGIDADLAATVQAVLQPATVGVWLTRR